MTRDVAGNGLRGLSKAFIRFERQEDGVEVRLTDAKIWGPVEKTISGPEEVACCASGIVETLFLPAPKSAAIAFYTSESGKEIIRTTTSRRYYGNMHCQGPLVQPFPELERLRDRTASASATAAGPDLAHFAVVTTQRAAERRRPKPR